MMTSHLHAFPSVGQSGSTEPTESNKTVQQRAPPRHVWSPRVSPTRTPPAAPLRPRARDVVARRALHRLGAAWQCLSVHVSRHAHTLFYATIRTRACIHSLLRQVKERPKP